VRHEIGGDVAAAPLRFSTMNCCPNRWLSACASTRAAMSPEAPAAKPMMMRTGRVG